MGGNKSGGGSRFEKIAAARIGIELGRWERRIFHLDLFLPEEITAPKPPMEAGAAADLNLGSFAALAIDLNESGFAVADNCDPARFSAFAPYLNDGVLAVTNDLDPRRLFAFAHDLNSGILTARPVYLYARSLFAWRAIVPG